MMHIELSHPQGKRSFRVTALIDTGADDFCYLDNSLAERLGLPVRDRRPVNLRIPTGKLASTAYSARVSIEGLDIHDRACRCLSYPIKKMRPNIDALLGRAFLREVRLYYDGPGGGVTVDRTTG